MLKTEYSWRFQNIYFFNSIFLFKKKFGWKSQYFSTNDVISVKAARGIIILVIFLFCVCILRVQIQ